MPSRDEGRGWSRLIAAVADQVVAGSVQDMHRAISDGVYRWLGPVGRPVQRVTDAATDGTYAVVRGSFRVAGELGAVAADRFGNDDDPSPAALKGRAVAHGVVDDQLLRSSPELDLDVTIRQNGREVPLTSAGLREAYPEPTSRLTVFVHGLVDTEAVWTPGAGLDRPLPDLATAAGTTPVLVRYGTGRAVGRNGADLAERLEELVASWPVPVTQLVLVGHSMGGLVIRAAGVAAVERGHRWPELVSDALYLATPHLGSWLEKAANVTTWTLRLFSRSAPIGSLIDRRSRGIKDLRFGALAEDAWGETPIDGLLTGSAATVPWVEGVTHHVVVGRLRPSVRHPLNAVLGDALVRSGSAAGTGRTRRIADGGRVEVVPVGASHSQLPRSAEVAALLGEVLVGGSGDAA